MLSVADSYQHCGQIVRRASTNFYWSFRLLPSAKRQAMAALYAFARHTDDLGDNDQPAAEREAALQAWRDSLAQSLDHPTENPILPALVDAVRQFQIPPHYLFEIIDGVAMDLHHQGYETFADLRHYCYHVASAVGLACLHIWGCHDLNAAREPAIQCGYAFQLTNILRDLREDAQHDRIYLPREELRRFHVFDNDLRNGTQDRRFLELMSFEVAHARELYKAAAATNRYLHADGKRMFSMMFHTYRGLLEKIARDPAAVFARRVRLSHLQKIKVAAVSVLRGVP